MPSDSDYFKRGFVEMLSELELIKSNPDRVFLIEGSDAYAYIAPFDPEKHIYIEESNLRPGFQGRALWTLGHELTHLNSVFNSKDFWYLSPGYDHSALNDSPFDVVRRPDIIFSGELPEGVFESSFALHWQTGTISSAGAVEAFNKFPEVSTRLARHNADTLINFASNLANARVMSDQFKRT